MIWYVYVLKCNNWKYYIWSTNNLERRLFQHKNWKVISTKNLLPIIVIKTKQYDDIKEARKIEYNLKKQKSKKITEAFVMDSFG
jgi:predicted GIY-YIG superfamily endonuclease